MQPCQSSGAVHTCVSHSNILPAALANYMHMPAHCSDLQTYMSYDSDMLALYNSLKTPVERSDLWRYSVMCKHGGIYTDADTLCVRPVQVSKHLCVVSSLLYSPQHCVSPCVRCPGLPAQAFVKAITSVDMQHTLPQ